MASKPKNDSDKPGECVFCAIVQRKLEASVVFETDLAMAFLDIKPLFPGHCLVVPKSHCVTMADAPEEILAHVMIQARRLTAAVERALGAGGTFVAVNNRVSQSVPHLHVHVVPRTKGDGLKGFFWPRSKYRNAEHVEQVRQAIAEEWKRA